ncbi:hypothetical protein NOE36_22240 [Escherichia coli]|uniref:hypothetical protein n=1 Tax=Escherichia coli TaxID=562 RepID=UPI002100C1FB|nr:hypothetical protein [Escherichia coli]MCQ1591433.1 hypothetical protein [Escherichia coli]MCQ1597570.1 hypothetical protein [Escherichia coli]
MKKLILVLFSTLTITSVDAAVKFSSLAMKGTDGKNGPGFPNSCSAPSYAQCIQPWGPHRDGSMTLVSPGVINWAVHLPPGVKYIGSEPVFSVGIEEKPVNGQSASLVYAYISNGTAVWNSPATQMYP